MFSMWTILALLPIIVLIVFSLVRSIQAAAIISFVATAVLFFTWEAPVANFLAALVVTGFSTFNILMIVFGAVFLYETMKAAGHINNISQSIREVHPAADVRFFMIAIGLTAFFEGVAGFGTPGAIVPLLLISMGYSPVLSVVAVLLFDGIFSAFGAVGTPLLAGLADNLGLAAASTGSIAVLAAWLLAASGIIFFAATFYVYRRTEAGSNSTWTDIAMYILAIAPFVAGAYLVPEYATIAAAFVMLAVAILVFTRGRVAPGLRSWLPYIILVVILLLPKVIPALRSWLNAELAWNSIFSTHIRAALKPLQSPLLPFLAVACFYTRRRRDARGSLGVATRKVGSVALLLFPVIAVAQLMQASGGARPSMISHLSGAFAGTGEAYVWIAPFIGMIGSFVTGSTTVSNIVFAASQQETALASGLDPSLVLSLQLAGASIGNAICLFNIIAACAVANITAPNKVLFKNLLPALAATLAVAAMAYFSLAP